MYDPSVPNVVVTFVKVPVKVDEPMVRPLSTTSGLIAAVAANGADATSKTLAKVAAADLMNRVIFIFLLRTRAILHSQLRTKETRHRSSGFLYLDY
jgi:hypothetical protein